MVHCEYSESITLGGGGECGLAPKEKGRSLIYMLEE